MIPFRTLHLTVGALGLAAFVLTGQYMHWIHNHLDGMPDGPRLFFRSAHLYLLWSSLLNLLLGCYLTQLASRIARRVQVLASAAILLGPVLLCLSFFFEQYNEELSRPLGRWAIYLALAGVLLHVAAVYTGSASRAASQGKHRRELAPDDPVRAIDEESSAR